MANKKENIKALFLNTRSRVIIIFTVIVLLVAVLIGFYKFMISMRTSSEAGADLMNAPAVQSIPGSLNPNSEYAGLVQKQNVSQAVEAAKTGNSAIPTIIRTHAFGDGVNSVGPTQGQGAVGFETLAREGNAGMQQSLWLQSLKDNNCSKKSIDSVVTQGAAISDLKKVCNCMQLKDYGYKFSELKPLCPCKDLKAAGFNAREMKDAGYGADQLRQCGFSACELKAAGFTAQEMKDGGFSDGELKGAGFSDNDIDRAGALPNGITTQDVQAAGCQVDGLSRLRQQGVTAATIRRVSGCSAAQLKAAGYNAQDLKNAGYSAADLLKAGYTPEELKDAGYKARDLLNAGLTPADLTAAGFSPDDLKAAEMELPPGFTPENIKQTGCDVDALKRERLAGVSAAAIHKYAGCSIGALKAAGFTNTDLANAGFTPEQIGNGDQLANATPASADKNAMAVDSDDAIKAAGCDPQALHELLNQGVSAKRIVDLNGCSAKALKDAGYNAQDLLNAGFTPKDLLAAGFTPDQINAAETAIAAAIKAAGCDSQKLHTLFLQGVSAKQIRDLNGCSAKALKDAGYNAKDLLNAGFTPQDLAAAGFTADQIQSAQAVADSAIKAAGCDPQKLHELFLKGVSARQIKNLNGCNVQALKDAGYDAKDLLNAGFTPAELAAAGFTADQIKRAQPVADATIKAVGCDPQKLHELFLQGVSAKRIKDLNGCSAKALKDAGYGAQDLLNAGFTPSQLMAAGFNPEQINAAEAAITAAIKAAGCDPQKLHGLFLQDISAKQIKELNGCSAKALKDAGYDAKDLLKAGFTPQELAAAGFTGEQMKGAQQIADEAIQAAGCDPQKLHALFLQDVSAKRIKDLNGCSAKALKDAGYSAKDLLNAGFTPKELVTAGFSPDQVNDAKAAIDNAIKSAGCDPQKLHDLLLQGITAKQIRDLNGCTASALKAAGFDARALTDAGFTSKDLAAAGFTAEQIKAVQPVDDSVIKAAGCDPQKLHTLFLQGVTAKQIRELNGCSAAALKQAGYDAKALIDAGFAPKELLAAGFTPDQVNGAQSVDDSSIKAAGCDPQKLHQLYLQGVPASQIHELNGCTAAALKQAGYDAKALADAGFTPAELLAAGFSPEDLTKAGLNPSGIIASGRTADCSTASLQAAHALGVSAITIKQTLGCSAKEMKDAGYTAAELKAAGFTAAELKDAGFSAADLKRAGFSAKELAAAGFNSQALKNVGFSAEELKAAGFSAEQLKGAGYNPTELKRAGFSAEELQKAGYSPQELETAGFLPQDSSLAGLKTPKQSGIPSSVLTLPSIGSPAAKATETAEAANAKQLEQIMKRQQTMMADQRYQQAIEQKKSAMVAAARETLQGWKAVKSQAYVGGPDVEKKESEAMQMGSQQLMGQQKEEVNNPNGSKGAIIKTGDVLFAVLDTSVNTDEPGPILATVVSGKLKGAKLIGSFVLPGNANKMVINFNMMSVPGANKTTSISAYAIDPDTARTALASRTNHHYLSRYGAMFAATFIEGFGNAFQSANTTIQIGGSGGAAQNTTIQSGIGRSILQNAVIGMATLGKSWGQVAQQHVNQPITVEVYSGTALGVLFTQDLMTL